MAFLEMKQQNNFSNVNNITSKVVPSSKVVFVIATKVSV